MGPIKYALLILIFLSTNYANAGMPLRSTKVVLPSIITNVAAIGDHKQKIVPKEYRRQARGVGTLEHSGGRYCTAFCIAPDLIATAAHCVDSRQNSRRLGNLRFRLRSKGGKSSRIKGRGNTEKRANTIVGTTRVQSTGLNKKSDQQHYDWALARLASPICKGRELATKNAAKLEYYDPRATVFGLFYQQSKGKFRVRYSDCDIRLAFPPLRRNGNRIRIPNPDDQIWTNCDIRPGGSGSPLFLVDDDGPVVFAIHSGDLTPKGKKKPAARVAVHIRPALKYANFMRRDDRIFPKERTVEIQRLLRSTGDYKSGVDGIYGRMTRQALLDFTRRNLFPVPIDRPIGELLPLMDLNMTPAPPPGMINAFEIYNYNPHYGIGHKSFAVNSDTKTWGMQNQKLSRDKAIEAAMERCAVVSFSASKKKAKKKIECHLYAVDNQIVFDADPSKQMLRTLVPNHLPTITRVRFNRDLMNYKGSKFAHYKALAVEITEFKLHSCAGKSEFEGAANCALNACREDSNHCRLYALGNKIVYGLDENTIALYREYYEAVMGR